MERIDNHAERMRDLLLEQYRRSPNLQSMMNIEAASIQTLEDEVYKLFTDMNLVNGYGKILDIIGIDEGEYRNGLSDEEYRARIYTRIAINSGHCDLESILTAVRKITDAISIKATPIYPANFSLDIRKDNFDLAWLPLIRSLPAAGIGAVSINVLPEAELFLFAGVVSSYFQLNVTDGTDQFPLNVGEDVGIIYTLSVIDSVPFAAPNSQGFGAIIPTDFVATDTNGATITFGDGSPWKLVSEGDEEFYTKTTYGGVFSGVTP